MIAPIESSVGGQVEPTQVMRHVSSPACTLPDFGTLDWPKSDKSDFGEGGGGSRELRVWGFPLSRSPPQAPQAGERAL